MIPIPVQLQACTDQPGRLTRLTRIKAISPSLVADCTPLSRSEGQLLACAARDCSCLSSLPPECVHVL
ncbi:hypothetical protein CCR91_21785 [Thiorhodovibrio winogradskyi]|nr:hypothetical protein [Thiorhodovibrio winogradskyi]